MLERIQNALQYRSALIARRCWQNALLNEHLIGSSPWINQFRDTLQKLAEIDVPVFFSGEPGCGRSLAARYLHKIGLRAEGPFLQRELVQEGTVTLDKDLAAVQGGTMVIKNIEYLSQRDQQQLVHHISMQRSPFRLVAISRSAPAKLAAQRQLLPELYYHFSLTHHECLPLCKRPGDIDILFNYYLQQACHRLNKPLPKLTTAFIKNLVAQPWYGNIHEVINAAELYAVGIMPFSNNLTPLSQGTDHPPLDWRIENYERSIIIEAMSIHQGKINDVATYLQIPRKKLYLRMKKYGINKNDYRC
ncbi:MAG: sigma 54-interacting transcriptional regulator [Enterobacteriaceae bacterium]